MAIKKMGHKREASTRQVVAEIRSGTPLAVNLSVSIDVVWTMNGTRVQVHFVCGFKSFAEIEYLLR